MSAAHDLDNVKAIKACRAGERVSFRARALRAWETGGQRMALVGDESALTRIELGGLAIEEGRSYEFGGTVREYPGGWHSVSLAEGGQALPLSEDVPISQDEAYIERTYRILAGVQRKRARREGRIEPWRHPAGGTRRQGPRTREVSERD